MDLREILVLHKRWLETGQFDGQRADFGADPGLLIFYTDDNRAVTLDYHPRDPLAALRNINCFAFPEGCDLREARFDGADLTDFILANCDLEGASFIGANLTRTRFDYSNLSRSKLSNVIGLRASFKGADLSEADLTSAHLAQANLTDSTLHRTVLHRAVLSEANLRSAHAESAVMDEVVLTGSDLSDVTLDDANLFGGDLSGVTGERLSAKRVRLTRARLSNCTLTHSNFDEASLEGVVLEASDLSNSRLDRANICAYSWDEWRKPEPGEKPTPGSEYVREKKQRAPSVTGVVLNGCSFYGARINVALLPWLPASIVRSAIRVEGEPVNPVSIFIAHASEDLDAALQIYAGLVREGFSPWIDARDLKVGEEWQRVIPSEIQKSDAVILCFSRNAIEKRGYIQNEFRLALETLRQVPFGRVFVIPIRLEECEVPQEFRSYQYVNYWEHDYLARIGHSLKDLRSK
jgi:uncharacterized protein YjbI with pentapeptide repeats